MSTCMHMPDYRAAGVLGNDQVKCVIMTIKEYVFDRPGGRRAGPGDDSRRDDATCRPGVGRRVQGRTREGCTKPGMRYRGNRECRGMGILWGQDIGLRNRERARWHEELGDRAWSWAEEAGGVPPPGEVCVYRRYPMLDSAWARRFSLDPLLSRSAHRLALMTFLCGGVVAAGSGGAVGGHVRGGRGENDAETTGERGGGRGLWADGVRADLHRCGRDSPRGRRLSAVWTLGAEAGGLA